MKNNSSFIFSVSGKIFLKKLLIQTWMVAGKPPNLEKVEAKFHNHYVIPLKIYLVISPLRYISFLRTRPRRLTIPS